jgi:hypothetical protein
LHLKIKTSLKHLIDRGWRRPNAKGSRPEKEKVIPEKVIEQEKEKR